MSIKFKQTNPGALERVVKRYRGNYTIAVGFPSSKTKSIEYPDGTSVIFVAIVNNFGSPSRGIPRRPFMSLSKQPAEKKIKPILKKMTHALNMGNTTKLKMAQTVGPVVEAVFKETITKLKTPPNSPETIRKKKSSNPLIDTGLMRQTVTFEVRKAKGGVQ